MSQINIRIASAVQHGLLNCLREMGNHRLLTKYTKPYIKMPLNPNVLNTVHYVSAYRRRIHNDIQYTCLLSIRSRQRDGDNCHHFCRLWTFETVSRDLLSDHPNVASARSKRRGRSALFGRSYVLNKWTCLPSRRAQYWHRRQELRRVERIRTVQFITLIAFVSSRVGFCTYLLAFNITFCWKLKYWDIYFEIQIIGVTTTCSDLASQQLLCIWELYGFMTVLNTSRRVVRTLLELMP